MNSMRYVHSRKESTLKCKIESELFIPNSHLKEITDRESRFVALVPLKWLSKLKMGMYEKIVQQGMPFSDDVSVKIGLKEASSPSWRYVFIQVIEKSANKLIVVPLPRQSQGASYHGELKSSRDLSYFRLLHYIATSNNKNLWRDSFRKYSGQFVPCSVEKKETRQLLNGIAYNDGIKEIFTRLYSCPIINLNENSTNSFQCDGVDASILPVIAVLETSSSFYVVQDFLEYNLQDCINYSPAILDSCNYKPLFLAFQLLNAICDLHDKGLSMGDITLADIFITDDLWIKISPRILDNIHSMPRLKGDVQVVVNALSDDSPDLAALCDRWIRGCISNFDYITALNVAAGRKYGDPKCHHVFPWITDFTSRNGPCWRDLTRSKFRLNKGDQQLDLTFEGVATAMGDRHLPPPHHISDILSDITYCVYLARVLPKSALQKCVRPEWVPAEYPASIQRMQQWTPDECIPEFFTDPSVFKSVHEDLPDLEIPSWATSFQDFVDCHKAALESNFVSERLHHWIDLTFGYKLSGLAAIKAKNVCLQLSDNHTSLSSCGIVQLFHHAHPQRILSSSYLSKNPPLVKQAFGASIGLKCNAEDDLKQNVWSNGIIHLPTGYNPILYLNALENSHHFISKEYNKFIPRDKVQSVSEDGMDDTDKILTAKSFKKVATRRRLQDLIVFACLLVELFAADRLRANANNLKVSNLKDRVENCRAVLLEKWANDKREVPSCIRPLLDILLQTDVATCSGLGRTCPITEFGLPPLTSHKLLSPGYAACFVHFPLEFPLLYATLKRYQQIKLPLDQTGNGSGVEIQNFPSEKMEELSRLLVGLSTQQSGFLSKNEWADFVIPLVTQILEGVRDGDGVVAALNLLQLLSRMLGPKESVNRLLPSLMKFYDNSRLLSASIDANNAKLYHRSFLVVIMWNFGCLTFLNNVVDVIVEAVAGCCHLRAAKENEKFPDGNIQRHLHMESEIGADKHMKTEISTDDDCTDDEGKDADNLDSLRKVLMDDNVATDEEAEDMEEDGNCVKIEEVKVVEVLQEATEVKPLIESHQISKISSESLIWLAQSLGPVLTARYVTSGLLRLLTISNGEEACADKRYAVAIDCLMNIAGIYGEELVVLQYIPRMSDLIRLCKSSKKITPNLESGLIAFINLFKRMVSFLSKDTLAKLMPDVLSDSILYPAIYVLSLTDVSFPSGHVARSLFASKMVECLYSLGMRLGHSVSKPLQKFFAIFDKVVVFQHDSHPTADDEFRKGLEELKSVFNSEFAHESYSLFAKYFGESFMQCSLNPGNLDNIQRLCAIYKMGKRSSPLSTEVLDEKPRDYSLTRTFVSGNKLHFSIEQVDAYHKIEKTDNSRHLKGAWLAYWEEEMRKDKKCCEFKQMKLQSFAGHAAAVKSIVVLDNENSFVTCSRDKTVKLWSLRNSGDGSSSQCQYTYVNHRKSVLSVAFNQRQRILASCDSILHLWDPFTGRLVSILRSGPTVNSVTAFPPPHAAILATNARSSYLNVADLRTTSYVAKLKIGTSISGGSNLIRCTAISSDANFVAVGESSGTFALLDLRVGGLLSSWKAHEGEMLGMTAFGEGKFATSSLDQTTSLWNTNGKILANLKNSPEPAHCLIAQGEDKLICGTTANRIGMHVSSDGENFAFRSYKLRSHAFKGVLTTMTCLPLNNALLMGSDSGLVTLFA